MGRCPLPGSSRVVDEPVEAKGSAFTREESDLGPEAALSVLSAIPTASTWGVLGTINTVHTEGATWFWFCLLSSSMAYSRRQWFR